MKRMHVLVAVLFLFLSVALLPGCTDKCERACERLLACFEKAEPKTRIRPEAMENCQASCNKERKKYPSGWNQQWDYIEPLLDEPCAGLLEASEHVPLLLVMAHAPQRSAPVQTPPIDTQAVRQPPRKGVRDGVKVTDIVGSIVKRVRDMIEITKDFRGDCDEVLKRLETYQRRNKKAIEALFERNKELEAMMTEAEREQYDSELLRQMMPILKESQKAMMVLAEKCPDHMDKIAEAMLVLR